MGQSEKEQVVKPLQNFNEKGLFAENPKKVPAANVESLNLVLKDSDCKPFVAEMRRMPARKAEAINSEFLKLKIDGVARESDSSWRAAPAVVQKKDGASRMCVD